MINLSVEPVEGVFIPKHPVTDKDMDLKLMIVGQNSREFYDTMQELSTTSTDDKQLISDMDIAIMNCVIGWDGKELEGNEFSTDALTSLLTDPRHLWLLTQLKMYFMDQANFFSTGK